MTKKIIDGQEVAFIDQLAISASTAALGMSIAHDTTKRELTGEQHDEVFMALQAAVNGLQIALLSEGLPPDPNDVRQDTFEAHLLQFGKILKSGSVIISQLRDIDID